MKYYVACIGDVDLKESARLIQRVTWNPDWGPNVAINVEGSKSDIRHWSHCPYDEWESEPYCLLVNCEQADLILKHGDRLNQIIKDEMCIAVYWLPNL